MTPDEYAIFLAAISIKTQKAPTGRFWTLDEAVSIARSALAEFKTKHERLPVKAGRACKHGIPFTKFCLDCPIGCTCFQEVCRCH